MPERQPRGARAGQSVNRVPDPSAGEPFDEPTDWASEFRRRGWAGQREYRLIVELADIEPRIWRLLLVPDTTPLPLLHRILQVAFGWNDRHLHEFKVGTVFFGVPDEDDPPPHIDEKHVRLYQLVHEPGERLTYLYDFGDSWEHDLVLEDMRAEASPVTPICLDAERAAPPEDCGGIPGYKQLLEALRDPNHPDHLDLIRAGAYDPEGVDLELINRRLARLPRGRARV